MRRTAQFCAVLCISLALTFGAQAGTVRVPAADVPALTLDLPDGWGGSFDDLGNLQIFMPDYRAFLQLSVGKDAAKPITEVAEEVFSKAGAPQYSRTEAASLGGRPAHVFYGELPTGVVFNMTVILLMFDATHLASVAHLETSDEPASVRELLDQLAAAVQIVETK